MPKNYSANQTKRPFNKRRVLLWFFISLLIAGIIFAVVKHNLTASKSKSPVIETVTPSSGNTNNADSKSDNPKASHEVNPQAVTLSSLISPYGTFVSNHYPSLSGKSAPSQEESVCTSNPGVSCYIEFTKDGITKKLPAQTTNSSGTTSWIWDIKKNGFTVGNWTITAVVVSGSNTKSRQDSLPLNVLE